MHKQITWNALRRSYVVCIYSWANDNSSDSNVPLVLLFNIPLLPFLQVPGRFFAINLLCSSTTAATPLRDSDQSFCGGGRADMEQKLIHAAEGSSSSLQLSRIVNPTTKLRHHVRNSSS